MVRAEPIRVVLCDHHRLLLEALTRVLHEENRFRVVAVFQNNAEALSYISEHRPDVVLLGMSDVDPDTLTTAAQIRSRKLPTKVVLLCDRQSDLMLDQAIRLRTSGFLLTSESVDSLVEALNSVMNGEQCYSRELRDRLTYDPMRRVWELRSESQLESLTTRQLEVLRLLARGQSVKEVAKGLHLSEKSVDSHKYRIMSKLNIHDRVELARFAIREGLISA